MRYLASIVMLTMVCSCGPSAREQEIDREISDLNSRLSRCDQLRIEENQAEGAAALAQWDQAAANSSDSISQNQEEEIRTSLSRELNIPPNKVAWKDIYRARAEMSKLDAERAASKKSGDYYIECSQQFVWRSRIDNLEKEKLSIK